MWQTDLVELIRGVLLDFDEPPIYTDARLQRLAVVAAHFVIAEGEFDGYYADLGSTDITPDPTDKTNTDYYNESLTNLIAIKAGCLMDNGEARKAAGQAVDIADGTSRISVRGISAARLAILQQGWCKHYDKLLADYFAGFSELPIGAAVLSPFRNSVPGTEHAFGDYSPNDIREYRQWR